MANAHNQVQREFIVKSLAEFKPPRAIVADFAALFPGVKIDENDVKRLDPKLTLVSPELDALFKRERERVLMDPASAVFANQAARLIALSQDAEFYASNNQLAERRAVFRQIAEEQGVVGGKGTKSAGGAAAPGVDNLAAITRTIVDPAAQAEPAA